MALLITSSDTKPDEFQSDRARKHLGRFEDLFVVQRITKKEGDEEVLSREFYLIASVDLNGALEIAKEETKKSYSGDWSHSFEIETDFF